MINFGRIFQNYLKSVANWHYKYFFYLFNKRAVHLKRKQLGLTSFPQPEEIFDERYCFVLSTGRCGTGLITKILDKSPQLLVCHNPKPELEYVSSFIHRTSPSLESLKLSIIAARFDFFVNSFLVGRIFIETNNRITFFAPALAQLFPNAKFIHLIRNPADFVRSGMRRKYYKNNTVQHQRFNPVNNYEWMRMTRLEKVAWEWNEINSSIDNFKSMIHQSRMMTIKSEQLFSQSEIIPALFDFIAVTNPFEGARGSKQIDQLLRRPVNKQILGSFPRYQDWSAEDKSSLKHIVILAPKYGYNLM
jgi:hypothetical protein